MSTLKVSNINSLAASTPPVINDSSGTPVGTFCRAWVNFNGTGTTSTNQTIRASFNVSSVYKNATGDYTVNFTTAMADANYSAVSTLGFGFSGDASYGVLQMPWTSAPTTTAIRLACLNYNSGALYDHTYASVAIFR